MKQCFFIFSISFVLILQSVIGINTKISLAEPQTRIFAQHNSVCPQKTSINTHLHCKQTVLERYELDSYLVPKLLACFTLLFLSYNRRLCVGVYTSIFRPPKNSFSII
ncbi:MAG: hypothetical protein WC627_04435 [Legionella sp.]|jgi:hypothetical protein